MPFTVPVSFDKFIENISISGDQQSTSTKRKDHIVSLLKNAFTILDAFATGSIPKYTAVKGSDLDVMVVLHYGKHIKDKKPSQVLKSVQSALSEYRTGVRRNGQAVTLSYESWPSVDIVPVSRTANDDGSVSHYNVPNMNDETWLLSRPRKHAANIAAKVSSYGPEFRRIIRMIKWWNKIHSDYLQSYHIEAIALQALTGSFSHYSWEVSQFFDKAHSLLGTSLWYEGGYADDYLDNSSRQEALKRLSTAKGKASSAWYAIYGTNNNHEKAIELWRQIFGDKFPPYGS